MTRPDDDLASALESLKAEYRGDLARQVDRVADLWSQVDSGASPAASAELAGLLHQIAGAAGTFGFGEVGAIAAQAEGSIAAWRDRGAGPEARERSEMNGLIGALRAALPQA